MRVHGALHVFSLHCVCTNAHAPLHLLMLVHSMPRREASGPPRVLLHPGVPAAAPCIRLPLWSLYSVSPMRAWKRLPCSLQM